MLQKGELPAVPGLGAGSWTAVGAAELWRYLPSEASPQPRVTEGGNAVASLWRFRLCSSLRHPECLGQIRDTTCLLHPSRPALRCWVSFLHGLAELCVPAGSSGRKVGDPRAELELASSHHAALWSKDWPPSPSEPAGELI